MATKKKNAPKATTGKTTAKTPPITPPTRKPAPAPAPKNANKARPVTSTPARRKIGERTEVIVERLSITQVEAEREKACNLMRRRDELVEKKKSLSSDLKAQIDAVDAEMKTHLSAAASARRDVEITVEEWLTDKNQVERYRVDTGELIGDRIASVTELQEKLPLDDPNAPDEDDGDDEEADESPNDAERDDVPVTEGGNAAPTGDEFGGE